MSLKPTAISAKVNLASVLLALGAALVAGLFFTLQQYTDHVAQGFDFEFSWAVVSARNLSNYLLWAALFPFVLTIARRIISKGTPDFKLIGSSLLLVATHRIGAVLLYRVVYLLIKGRWISILSQKNVILTGLFSSLFEFGAILGVTLAVLYYRRYTEKQKDLKEAELSALKMQLNPHFLFNTLHSISSMIDIDPDHAQKMITQFGFLMRRMLEEGSLHMVPLEKEMEFMKTYLHIEQARFMDKMETEIAEPVKTANAAVPHMILQPLVENAVVHGVSKSLRRGVVRIDSEIVSNGTPNGYLKMTVRNSAGTGPSQPSHRRNGSSGVGLRNVQRRLEQIYPGRHEFNFGIDEQDGGVFKTEITIPYERFQSKNSEQI